MRFASNFPSSGLRSPAREAGGVNFLFVAELPPLGGGIKPVSFGHEKSAETGFFTELFFLLICDLTENNLVNFALVKWFNQAQTNMLKSIPLIRVILLLPHSSYRH
jgi:hypothetical protein